MRDRSPERYYDRAELEAEADAQAALMYPPHRTEERQRFSEWYFQREVRRRSSPFPA